MSYILDALNKSEQDRKRNRAPGLDTMHRGSTPPPPTSRPWVVWILLIAVVNGGFLAYWLGTRRPATAPVPAEVTRAPATAPAKNPPRAPPAPVNAAPAQSPAKATTAASNQQDSNGQLVTPADALSPESTGSATTESADNPIRISDLPVDVQQQIPDMTFSSHIYSDEAKFRMVNINGRLLHEGDMVADGIRLVRITEEGVVLTFKGYTFEVSVLHDWSFN